MKTTPTFEVIVPFAVWRQAVMPMLTNANLVATGTLVRDPGRQPTGLLCNELIAGTRPQRGEDFPPLADWIAIASPPNESSTQPEEWLRRLQPRFAQMLVVLLVGLGADRRDWRGWTIERGEIAPLAGFRIVGPGMVHARAVPELDYFDEADPARWEHMRGAVGEGVFTHLRESRVALVGCSRTGTLAAGMLAALGVGRLALIDGDVIEMHNLDGMLLATEGELGENKAVALGRRLVAFRSDLAVTVLPRPLINHFSESALDGADLIVTCVDQDGARLRAAHWARDRLTPHLDIGAGVTTTATGERQLAADVRLLLPQAGCIRCVGGLGDLEQAEYELHAPFGALPRRPPEAWNARGRLGSLITLNSLAVSCGIQSWLDLLDGSLAASVWHRLRWQPGEGVVVNSALTVAGVGCAVCHRESRQGD